MIVFEGFSDDMSESILDRLKAVYLYGVNGQEKQSSVHTNLMPDKMSSYTNLEVFSKLVDRKTLYAHTDISSAIPF